MKLEVLNLILNIIILIIVIILLILYITPHKDKFGNVLDIKACYNPKMCKEEILDCIKHTFELKIYYAF